MNDLFNTLAYFITMFKLQFLYIQELEKILAKNDIHDPLLDKLKIDLMAHISKD